MNANKLTLPLQLSTNVIANKIRDYVSQLGPSSGYFSCILYCRNDKYYFLSKDKDFPYVPFDWTMYQLIRINAETILTSGQTMRRQPQIYTQNKGTFGKQQIIDLYKVNNKEHYNLIVYSRSMTNQEINSRIGKKSFKLLPLSQILPGKQQISFKQLAQRINQLGLGPVIYENGQATLNNALSQVKQGEKSFTELILLSLFEGQMPQKYIQKQYDRQIIQKYFSKVWESQKIQSIANQDNKSDKETKISLKFVIYLRK